MGRPFIGGVPGSGRGPSEVGAADLEEKCLLLDRRRCEGGEWISDKICNLTALCHILKVEHTKLQYVHQSGWPGGGFCVWCACSACVCVGSLPGYFGLLPLSKHMLVRLRGNFPQQVSASALFQCSSVNGPSCKCKWNYTQSTDCVQRHYKHIDLLADSRCYIANAICSHSIHLNIRSELSLTLASTSV